MNYPSIDIGGSGSPLVFLHANGYPPACYQQFLSLLSRNFCVGAFLQRPLWGDEKPEEFVDWFPLSEDLIEFLQLTEPQPIIAVGHSMGGMAILRAAIHDPKLFKAIILLDPVLFPPFIIYIWKFLHALKMEYHVHPLIPMTLNRRQSFTDRDSVFGAFRKKEIFRYFTDEALKTYINGITCPNGDGYKLCYSVEWESRIYATSVWRDMDIWRNLPNLRIPTLIIRGKESDTFLPVTAHRIQQKNSNIAVEEVKEATHLLPLEQPDLTSELAVSFLEKIPEALP